MSEFAAQMIADLRGFSGQLLKPGAGDGRSAGRTRAECGTESVLFGAIEAMTRLIPHLLDELDDVEDPRNTVQRRSWTATRAKLSRSPADWTLTAAGVVPACWTRTDPVPEPDIRALSWILHLIQVLSSELDPVVQRTERYIEEARASRRGVSKWAVADITDLEALSGRLRTARFALDRSRNGVARQSGGRVRSSARAPSPYPRGRSWWRLRDLAANIEDKSRTLAARIADLLEVAPEIADEPLLYQRWCGMRLVESLMSMGWSAEGDYVGALFLAGHVSFHKDASRVELWVEGRLTREAHPSGFLCVAGADVTPDFLLVTPGSGGLDAFVLDATKSTDDDVLQNKRKYLDTLQGVAPAMIAGVVSGPRRPLRSWACAPFDLGHCRLATQNGSAGVVPMHPLAWNPAPLRAWLSDLERHARAWS